VFGKPAILGARPPFAGPRLHRPNRPTLDEYRTLLSSSNPAPAAAHRTPSADGAEGAFVTFEMMDAYVEALELGGMKYHVPARLHREAFFRRIVDESAVPLESQRIFKVLRAFEESSDPVLLNWSKLNPSVAEGAY
jgi:hypothetical protein